MSYLDKLRQSAQKTGSIVCMGLDPEISTFPPKYERCIKSAPYFLEELFKEMKEQNVLPGAFKPNEGYYVKFDKPLKGIFQGSIALGRVILTLKEMFPEIPIIVDSKRGDIAKSSKNYAEQGFGDEKEETGWQADAVTVHGYMGTDSVMPFADYCKSGKGVYILDRTSNPGAKDLQNLLTLSPEDVNKITEFVGLSFEEIFSAGCSVTYDELLNKGPQIIGAIEEAIKRNTRPLYMAVAGKIVEWSKDHPGVGAVVGATSLTELSDLARFYSGKDIPLLIPGVGGQGGKADEVIAKLIEAGYDLSLARINSSSGITHPWEKNKDLLAELTKNEWKDYAKACVAELHKLNEAIGYKAVA